MGLQKGAVVGISSRIYYYKNDKHFEFNPLHATNELSRLGTCVTSTKTFRVQASMHMYPPQYFTTPSSLRLQPFNILNPELVYITK